MAASFVMTWLIWIKKVQLQSHISSIIELEMLKSAHVGKVTSLVAYSWKTLDYFSLLCLSEQIAIIGLKIPRVQNSNSTKFIGIKYISIVFAKYDLKFIQRRY